MYQQPEPSRTTEDKMKDIKIMLDKYKSFGSKINIYTKKGKYFNITHFKFILNKRVIITELARISIKDIIRVEESKINFDKNIINNTYRCYKYRG